LLVASQRGPNILLERLNGDHYGICTVPGNTDPIINPRENLE